MKESEFLAQARDILARSWTRGIYRNNVTGEVCSEGACERVALLNLDEQDIIPTLARAKGILNDKAYEIYSMNVVTFNDSHKQQDALDLFDKAIIELEEYGK